MYILTYPAIFYTEETTKQYFLKFIDFEQLFTIANSEKEMWENAHKILKLYLQSKINFDEGLPEPTNIDDLELKEYEKVGSVSVQVISSEQYTEIGVLIPRYLEDYVNYNNIDTSKILIDALKKLHDKS